MAHRHSLKLDSTQDMLRGMIFHKVEDDKHLLWGLLHVKVIGCKKLRNLDGMNVRSLLSNQAGEGPERPVRHGLSRQLLAAGDQTRRQRPQPGVRRGVLLPRCPAPVVNVVE